MKKIITIATAMTVLLSCQEIIMLDKAEGSLSVSLENVPAVEVVTKADGESQAPAVSPDKFNVYVSSSAATYTYVYDQMPTQITVPVGFYTVSADNVTEETSLSQPDAWGQVRYFGTSDSKEVKAGSAATEFSVTCTMVNTALSVSYGEYIATHFTDYKVTVYTDEDRKLEYTAATEDKVGYFSPKTLTYVFSGKYLDNEEVMTITGTRSLQPATHLHLTFKISQQNGTIDKPVITVDATCTDVYQDITVDPSGNGSFVVGEETNNK